MKKEPVAWIIDVKMTDCDDNFIWNTGDYPDWQIKDWIPLYIHPVKELTDEEILEELLIPKSEWNSYKAHHCLKQIRAILRKASEK
jgi:hypothetical protein